MGNQTVLQDDEVGERRFWAAMLRWLWSILIVLLTTGALAGVTAALRWAPFGLLAALGVLAGGSLSLALLGSARSRELTGLVLGAIVLPALAAWLSGLAAVVPGALPAHGAGLTPFLVHLTVTLAACVAIARVWRSQPEAAPPGAAGPNPDDGGAP